MMPAQPRRDRLLSRLRRHVDADLPPLDNFSKLDLRAATAYLSSPLAELSLPGRERAFRQVDHLASTIHCLEVVDVVLRTLPAIGNLQSHEICDAADKRIAIGRLGVPDRRTRLQFLDVCENPLCIRLVQVNPVTRGQVLRIEIAVTCPGLGRHPHHIAKYIIQAVSRRGKARDFNLPFACPPIPDESVSPTRRRSGPEIDVVRALC